MESSVLSSRVLCRCGKRIFRLRPRKEYGSSDLFGYARHASKDQTSSSVVRVFTGQESSSASPKEIIEFLRIDSFKCNEQRKHAFGDVNQETITPRVSRFTAELNVKILCGKQTSQLEELTVNLNGRLDSSHRQFFISRALTIPTATVYAGFYFFFHKQSKVSLGKFMTDHLTFD